MNIEEIRLRSSLNRYRSISEEEKEFKEFIDKSIQEAIDQGCNVISICYPCNEHTGRMVGLPVMENAVQYSTEYDKTIDRYVKQKMQAQLKNDGIESLFGDNYCYVWWDFYTEEELKYKEFDRTMVEVLEEE